MQGGARHLAAGGRLITYGPYFERDVPSAPSDLVFDSSLRERNVTWGIRYLHDVVAQAELTGLRLFSRFEMPSNNLLLVFKRSSQAAYCKEGVMGGDRVGSYQIKRCASRRQASNDGRCSYNKIRSQRSDLAGRKVGQDACLRLGSDRK